MARTQLLDDRHPTLRIGLLAVYFGLFDAAMPPEFRQEREAFAEAMRIRLEQFGSVVYPGVVDDDEAGQRAGELFARSGVDVIVFAPTMAAPPSYGWEAVRDLPRVPLVAVGAQELINVPDDYDTEEATRRSLTVGLVMFTNVLVRKGRRFTTLVSSLVGEDLDAALGEVLRSADAAATVARSRLLAIGKPIPGYMDIEVTGEQLTSLGVEVVNVDSPEIATAFEAVGDGAVAGLMDELRDRFDADRVDDQVLARSARLALAMKELCRRTKANAGAVNCHGDALRWNPGVGVTACLGVTLCTEVGMPFACTGDIPTAIALIIGKRLAGSALYCELYQVDLTENWILVANGGEGDPTIRPTPSEVTLLPEDHYLGHHGPGTAAAFEITRGPATLISLSPVDDGNGWILVGAEGQILDSKHHAMEGPNGMFRFGSGETATAYARWCEAGATHHAALLPGHHGRALRRTAEMLRMAYVVV